MMILIIVDMRKGDIIHLCCLLAADVKKQNKNMKDLIQFDGIRSFLF
jgi:hypothetical protein